MKIEIATGRGPASLLVIDVPEHCSVAQALAQAGIEHRDVGVFAKPAGLDYVLREGDRIELYFPLLADAKQHRRERAAANPLKNKKKCSSSEAVAPNKCSSSEAVAPKQISKESIDV
jgi:putative ubiquitin-RnfH superfamily antitoxin RatB of RatAB toxin-antitoxin module